MKTREQLAEDFSESSSIYESAKDDTYFGFIHGFSARQKQTDKIILDALNKLRSELSNVERVKLTKVINKEKIELLKAQIDTLLKLQNKLKC